MKNTINIYSKRAEKEISAFKDKEYQFDIRLDNVHLKSINDLTRIDIFSKNDLYVGGETLWTAMQPKGENRHHNYHDLTPEDIVNALRNITKPYCVLKNNEGRISIISSIKSHLGVPLHLVIEIGASLKVDNQANINKLVTLFPLSKIDSFIKNIGINSVYYINIGNKAK